MRTPKFWNRRGMLALCLWPVSWVYPLATWLRILCVRPKKIEATVICIGGLTAGGAGKTPLAMHVGQWCKEREINAWFVSRGYGGTQTTPIKVKRGEHTAQQVGDEPLLLASVLPTAVGKDRVKTAQFAARQGAKVIILDDGFQNPHLHKDFSIVAWNDLGNGFCIPAGNLREWQRSGLKRADCVVVIGDANAPKHHSTLRAKTKADAQTKTLKGKKLLAFCGLAYPEKFYTSLHALGAELVTTHSFADHHQYKESEIEKLAQQAKECGAILVTTRKDAVRLNQRLRSLVTVVDISLEFDAPQALERILHYAISK